MAATDRVRLGMVGGGQGAFIGAVHRIAARLDDRYVLVCGALSSDPVRARASAQRLGLDPTRSYGSYAEMFAAERSARRRHRGGGDRDAEPPALSRRARRRWRPAST